MGFERMVRSKFNTYKKIKLKSIYIIGIDHVVAKTTYLYNYAKTKNTKVTFFTSDNAGFSSAMTSENIKYLNFPHMFNWIKILFYLIYHRPDHVELYFSRIYFETFPAVIFCRILRIPICLVTRGKDLRDHEEHKFIRKILTKFICKQSNVILPKENSHVRVLEKFNLSNKTFVKEIHNGIPYEEFNEVKFSKTSTTFLFLNAFRELRNLDLLLKAFALLKRDFPKTHLILVGSSLDVNFLPQESENEKKLLNLISQLGIDKAVEVHPFSSNPWKNIRDVLAFILPADQVWLNNALLEAMSYSIPPIIADAERADDIVTSGETGIICNKDINSIYHAMRKVLENPSKAEDMGIKSKTTVKEKFSSEKVGKEIYSIYEHYLWKK